METSPATWPPASTPCAMMTSTPRGRRPAGICDRADLVENLHARRVGTPRVRRRITPEQGEDGHPLFQADGDLILDGEVEWQIHPERPGGERPHAADLLAENRRRAELCLKNAEAAGVAHRRDEVRAGQVRSHRRGDDGVFDPQHLTVSRAGSRPNASAATCPTNPGSRKMCNWSLRPLERTRAGVPAGSSMIAPAGGGTSRFTPS